MPTTKPSLKQQEQPEQKLTPEQEAVLLQGLSRTSWAAKALLNELMKDEDGNFVNGTFDYPPGPGMKPVPHVLLGLDSGKRATKITGVDDFHRLQTVNLPNAYCSKRDVQIEESRNSKGKEEQKYLSWKRLSPAEEGEQAKEEFEVFDQALPYTDEFTVGDSHLRLRERRVKNFTYAALVYQLMEMGLSATEEVTVKGRTQILPKLHHLIVALGLPYQDVQEMSSPLEEAIQALKGQFSMEVTDLRTGNKEIWMGQISAIYPVGQARGTYLAVTTQLNGDSAIPATLVAVEDGGGGDAYEYIFDQQGDLQTVGERKGNGSVDLAMQLRNLVRKRLHLPRFTLIQAQQALINGYVRKAGNAQFPIPELIDEVSSGYENLVTRLEPSQEALDTLIVYTGGLTALLADRLEKMLGMSGKNLVRGRDYLIIPAKIAPILNAIGLFVYTYLRVRDEIFEWAEKFLDLQDLQLEAKGHLSFLRRSNLAPEDQQIIEAQRDIDERKALLAAHAAQYYPDYIEQVKLEREEQKKDKSAS